MDIFDTVALTLCLRLGDDTIEEVVTATSSEETSDDRSMTSSSSDEDKSMISSSEDVDKSMTSSSDADKSMMAPSRLFRKDGAADILVDEKLDSMERVKIEEVYIDTRRDHSHFRQRSKEIQS